MLQDLNRGRHADLSARRHVQRSLAIFSTSSTCKMFLPCFTLSLHVRRGPDLLPDKLGMFTGLAQETLGYARHVQATWMPALRISRIPSSNFC